MNMHGKTNTEKPANTLSHWALFILPLWGFLVLILTQINFPVSSQSLVGPDDYMRAVRIFDLLRDQAHPYLQPRMGVPPGGEVVWSRMSDMPLYLLTLAFKPFTGNQALAFFWASTVLPLIQLLGMLFLLCWAVSPLTGAKKAALSLLALLLMTKVIGEYKPGRIDHHGWQIMLMLGGYGAILRSYFAPETRCWPIIAGICFGTGFAVGADLILWGGLAAILSGVFWLCGRDYERPNLIFGISLFTTTLLFYGLFKPPGGYGVAACDVLSVTFVAIAFCVPAFWGAIKLSPPGLKDNAIKRASLGTLFSIVLITGLYCLFPKCFTNIYGLDGDLLYRIWISQDHESRPLWAHAEHYPFLTLYFVATILLSFAVSLWALITEKENRALWVGFCIILALGICASAFHLRLMTFMQLLAIWPLSWGFAALWTKARSMTFGVRELGIVGGVFLVLVTALSMMNETQMKTESASEDIKHVKASTDLTYCPVAEIAPALRKIEEQQTLITSYIFNGSELLFRTRHRVLAAPYHRNAAGIEATYKILVADADNEARELAKEHNVNLVLICPGYWPYPESEIKGENALIRRLLKGTAPSWLAPEDDMHGGGFKVYRVQ